jgi:ribosomal protein L44E
MKRKNVYDPYYISERDSISLEEAVEWVENYKKSKATSLDNFIRKYGREEGYKKFEEFKEKSLYKGHRSTKPRSKNSIKFWISKGYSEEESKKLSIDHQHKISPLHIQYWLDKGYSKAQAKKEIRKLHDRKIGNPNLKSSKNKDSISFSSIKRRYPKLSKEQQTQLYFDRLENIQKAMERNGHRIPSEMLSQYNKYKREVSKWTKLNEHLLDLSKRGRIDRSGATNIEHKFSISRGFMEGISPKIIGSIHNLEVMDAKLNTIKQNKCSISKEELLEKFNEDKID